MNAAVDIVNILYNNLEFCKFRMFIQDTINYFSSIEVNADYFADTLIPQLQTNLFQICSKGMDLFTTLTSMSDE